MILFEERVVPARNTFSKWVIGWAVCVLCFGVPQIVQASSELIPQQIADVPLGASFTVVMDKIKSDGTYRTEPLPREGRRRVVWLLPKNPYYKNIMFYFTEKDRLFIIRFTLDDPTRTEAPALKKAFFKKFDFSWDNPSRLRIKDDDALLYASEKNDRVFFIECTDRNTHEKAFELFDRLVSSEDKLSQQPEKQTETSEKESSPPHSVSPKESVQEPVSKLPEQPTVSPPTQQSTTGVPLVTPSPEQPR